MPVYQSVTISSASSNTTTYTRLNIDIAGDAPQGHTNLGHQVARISGSMTVSAATATIRFVMTDGTTVFDYIDVSFTGSGPRTAAAGGSGDYVATVAATNANFIDLWGADAKLGQYWAVGAPTISSGTVTVRIAPTRAF